MKYRDHRGSLARSMETVQEFNSVDELIDHLNKTYQQKPVVEVKFDYLTFDYRTGWETYCVIQRLEGETKFQGVVGMSDGKF